jgi:hypothetical protein
MMLAGVAWVGGRSVDTTKGGRSRPVQTEALLEGVTFEEVWEAG